MCKFTDSSPFMGYTVAISAGLKRVNNSLKKLVLFVLKKYFLLNITFISSLENWTRLISAFQHK